MAEEEDRISCLPDLLLVEIISRIKVKIKDYEEEEEEEEKEDERLMTTKEAIKTTSTISKRWQHLWTKLATLSFIYFYDGDFYDDVTRVIGNTLTQCPTDVNLNKFKLKILCSVQHTSQVNSWIRYAFTRNVQDIDLLLWDPKTGEEFSFYDELFFNNSCITRIKLYNCVFCPPNATICWDQLKFLSLKKARLVGDSIGIILSGSPCLETLDLAHVKDITLGDYNCLDALSRLRDKGFQFSRVGADGDEDRITELMDGAVAAAAET
uniref:At1g61320/AtMIF1 LRR domain-containing protein n=1 Tax=Tanacetum cinerariifolium TaxID=118510 RepID=A0A699JSA2_TANCI|nr:hypothetical protein [Tanacetum cinerariifolium]